jgi:hypothetical protein
MGSKRKVHIAVSMSDENVFFIFREDLTEVKCTISKMKVVNPERYRLTKREVVGIRKFFIGIDRVNISYRPYSKRKRNKV